MRLLVYIAAVLVAVDQGIKLLVAGLFMDAEFAIIPGVFYFRTWQNIYRGMIPHLLGWEMPAHIAVLATLCAMLIVVVAYRLMSFAAYNLKRCRRMLRASLPLIFAGAVCKLFDDVIWGGSLDFIRIPGFIIFDLKDVYIIAGTAMVLFVWVVYMVNYFLMSKDERREEDKRLKPVPWFRAGLPTTPKEETA